MSFLALSVKLAKVNTPSASHKSEALKPNNFLNVSAGSAAAGSLTADPSQFFKYAQCGKTELVSTLLNKQLRKVNETDLNGHTALFHAVIKGQVSTSNALKQYFQATLNDADMRALKEAYFAAIKEENFTFAKFLIDHGFIHPNETDAQGHTAAFYLLKNPKTNASGVFLKTMSAKMTLNKKDQEVLAKPIGEGFEQQLLKRPPILRIKRHSAPIASSSRVKTHAGCHYPCFF